MPADRLVYVTVAETVESTTFHARVPGEQDVIPIVMKAVEPRHSNSNVPYNTNVLEVVALRGDDGETLPEGSVVSGRLLAGSIVQVGSETYVTGGESSFDLKFGVIPFFGPQETQRFRLYTEALSDENQTFRQSCYLPTTGVDPVRAASLAQFIGIQDRMDRNVFAYPLRTAYDAPNFLGHMINLNNVGRQKWNITGPRGPKRWYPAAGNGTGTETGTLMLAGDRVTRYPIQAMWDALRDHYIAGALSEIEVAFVPEYNRGYLALNKIVVGPRDAETLSIKSSTTSRNIVDVIPIWVDLIDATTSQELTDTGVDAVQTATWRVDRRNAHLITLDSVILDEDRDRWAIEGIDETPDRGELIINARKAP